MPVLPLDYPEAYASTLGVMLYPGVDPLERSQARSFASQYVRDWLPTIYRTGNSLNDAELNRILDDAGNPLDDVAERWSKGTLTGQMLRVFLSLAHTHPVLATWSNVMRLMKIGAARSRAPASDSSLYAVRSRFASVAHLWAAWLMRDESFRADFGVRGTGDPEFQSFLAESEVLRQWGQTWRHEREKAEPPLPVEVWSVPDDWQPPAHQTGWAQTGDMPLLELPQELVSQLPSAGRPRKKGQ